MRPERLYSDWKASWQPGHEVRLVPPIYVKPFVRRQKNDAADAEAICEAATRPTMRFVPVKSEEQQSRCMVFRARDLLVRPRTQKVNALRSHLAEFGIIAPQGTTNVERLTIGVAGEHSGGRFDHGDGDLVLCSFLRIPFSRAV